MNDLELKQQPDNELMDWSLDRIEKAIIDSSVIMARSMLEIGKGLKAICDGNKYAERGYSSFKEYMEDATAHTYPFSYSQARKHIRVYERFGTRLTELSCAKLEVLDILRSIPAEDFEALEDSGVLAGISKREAEELRQRLDAANEQISFLETETAELKKNLKETENKPVEIITQEPSEEQIKKITSDIEKKHREKIKKLEKEKKELARTSSEMQAELSVTNDRVRSLESKLRSAAKTADAELIEFKLYFSETQESLKKLLTSLGNISDPEKHKTFKNAAVTFVEAILNDLKN